MSENKYTEVEGIDATTYAGKAALACKKKARAIMGEELLIFHLVDFVTFIELNNKFMDLGIHITDDNKEKCYIKIIEQDNLKLIDDLETYINLKDEIKMIREKKEEYQKIISKLQNLDDFNDENAVNNVVEDYLRR